MEVLPRIFRQLNNQLKAMSLVQRAISVAFVVIVVLALGRQILLHNPSAFQPVARGKVFGSTELEFAERTLTTAGLIGFRRDGQRLLAPEKDLERYNAALMESDSPTVDFGSQMLKQYETLGPFSTDRQRQQMKEAMLLQELRRTIRSVPEIEDARVTIASSEKKTGWNHRPRSTASITITPRLGREISITLVNSLRHVVASMVPDLTPTDVTIFDVSRGQVYTGETSDDSTESRYRDLAREMTLKYEQQIRKALSHIPGVVVIVQVNPDVLRSQVTRAEIKPSRDAVVLVANRPVAIEDTVRYPTGYRGSPDPNDEPDDSTLFESTEPKAFLVSVSIPHTYVRDVLARQIAKSEKRSGRRDFSSVEDEVVVKVERIVRKFIPLDTASHAISVACVDQIDNSNAVSVRASSVAAGEQLTVWSGITVLGFLGLFAFAMRRKAKRATRQILDASSVQGLEPDESDDLLGSTKVPTPVPTLDRAAVLRDEIRELVKSDHVASAELLGKWLSEAPQ